MMRGRPARILCVTAAAALLIGGCRGAPAPGRGETPSRDTLRVLAYNIHHGEGMDSVVDLERIAAIIREVDPDLVALQEVDSVTIRTGGVDQAVALAELTGLESIFGGFMPYQGGAYGMAVLSRWPVAESRNFRLPDGAEPRTALAVRVTSPATGRIVRFVGIHFYRTEEERLGQATRLEEYLSDDSVPTILAGDFNSMPDSEVMRYLRRGWTVVTKDEDRFTFPSYEPAREIDYVLLRPAARFVAQGQRLLDEPVASDHRPLVVDLELRD